MRDHAALLASEKFWDHGTQALFEAHREPLEDCILQIRGEVEGLCAFLEAHEVRSYLEVGVWTGRLVTALHRIFRFDVVAACDQGWAGQLGLPIQVPPETRFFEGNSESPAYRAWREALGPVDFVFIDANHSFKAVSRDFEINRSFPHRFLAFHDITGGTPQTVGVRRFWEGLRGGRKWEIVHPHVERGLDRSTMGIGIWAEDGQTGGVTC